MPSRRPRQSELKVVFDTSVLYTKEASDLFKPEVAEMINENRDSGDLVINWYLPEVVRHERQYQMYQSAYELLGPVQKLEKVLGHNLNITQENLEQRVKSVIDEKLSSFNIQVLRLETSEVNWHGMMLDSAYRRAPFQGGQKEKGFRDALVAEAFVQLVSQSPSTPRVCRIVLVCADNLLIQALRNRLPTADNVRIVKTLEELKGLINTLASEVDEKFIGEIAEKAGKLFFEKKAMKIHWFTNTKYPQRLILGFKRNWPSCQRVHSNARMALSGYSAQGF